MFKSKIHKCKLLNTTVTNMNNKLNFVERKIITSIIIKKILYSFLCLVRSLFSDTIVFTYQYMYVN